MSDAEVLKAAGLDGWHGVAQFIAVLFGVIAALSGAAMYTLEQIAQRQYDRELRQEGLGDPLWRQSERDLARLGFERREIDERLALFQHQPERANDGVPLVEVVIRRNRRTVAVAQVVALDVVNAWDWGSSDRMTDGTTVEDAVMQSNIPRWLAQRSDDGIDVIGVGIASLATASSTIERNPPVNVQENLVERRATQLVTKLHDIAGFVTSRPVQYWTLELGSAQTLRRRDSPEERRQRAAIIVALSRRINVEDGPITPDDALALITTNVDVYGTDLTDFQNSASSVSFLKQLPSLGSHR